ncbi:MAG: helix-turn-helix transcriptional regulator [Eubacteriales bacterium]|nr:helix-turn-helix transcriptional regulator [Eubacteriales bacterium]
MGEKIKELRKQRGLSQQDLSDKSNVPQTTISDIELNKVIPSIEKVVRIAKALNVPLEELLKV